MTDLLMTQLASAEAKLDLANARIGELENENMMLRAAYGRNGRVRRRIRRISKFNPEREAEALLQKNFLLREKLRAVTLAMEAAQIWFDIFTEQTRFASGYLVLERRGDEP